MHKKHKYEDLDFSNLTSEQWKKFKRGDYKIKITNKWYKSKVIWFSVLVGILLVIIILFP
jgi:hypothetical protein